MVASGHGTFVGLEQEIFTAVSDLVSHDVMEFECSRFLRHGCLTPPRPCYTEKKMSKAAAAAGIGILLVLLAWLAVVYLTRMPGISPRKPLPPLTETEAAIRDRLRAHVGVLAGDIGGRSTVEYDGLRRSAEYIERQLASWGYAVGRQKYRADGVEVANLDAELQGRGAPERIVVVGAHYDTAGGLPGANDNGSGVAAVLELARHFAASPLPSTVRWAFFVNEEPPFFQTPLMGSYLYAKRCRERDEDVAAMASLETVGYFSEQPGSQQYPSSLLSGYPNTGDFLAFACDVRSAPLLRRAVGAFRRGTALPSEGGALPGDLPGVGWSDHWAFWQFGYRAFMVTDTAPFRYPHYHTAQDTPDKLDYERMARAVKGFAAMVEDLAR
jgi:hypothetical protein